MDRVRQLATGSYLFEVATVNDDGGNVNAQAPYTVVMYDSAGAQVATGTPSHHDHVLQYSVPAATLTKLDTYRLVWTATVSGATYTWTSDVELVGGYLFEISDLRAQDRTFVDTTKYPTTLLKEVRNWVEDVIEGPRAANVAFVRRGNRVTVDGSNRDALMVPDLELRQVYSVTVGGSAWTSGEVATITADDGILWLNPGSPVTKWPSGRKNVTVHYVHGYDTPPGAITRAALMLAREYLVKSDLPNRATATQIGDQLFRVTIAGRDGVTGIPDVDAAIAQFGRVGFAIG
jgi:hypothetical protein